MGFDLATRLEERRQADLYRSRLTIDSKQGPEVTVDGRLLLSFCSNDYLGLAAHPEIESAFKNGLTRWGSGGGASHLVAGHFTPHHELEDALARFTGRESVLLFSNGYMANVAVLSVLGPMASGVLQDRLNHASLLDGGLLSGTRMTRYLHNDVASLSRCLEKAGECPLVVTDGVFSMDGDIANLPDIAAKTSQHGGWLIVDDAHGFGVLGSAGKGTLDHFGLTEDQVPVVVGTLGKAFGTYGAFVAGPREVTEMLIQAAHAYIYTTSQPPALACATLKALDIVQSDEERRTHLRRLIETFRREASALGLTLVDSPTAIQPIIVGENDKALAASRFLEDRSLLVRAIRPPTVPRGTARLRVTLTAAHTDAQLARLLDGLQAAVGGGLL